MTERALVTPENHRDAPASTGVRHIAPMKNLEIRAETPSGGCRFEGYAILWDDPTEIFDWLGSFTEVFRQGAFTKTIDERGPQGNGQIKWLRQHPQMYGVTPLTSVAAKYHSLDEDGIGLKFDAETIDTPDGRTLAVELREGVVDSVSIGFDAIREEWAADEEKRTVLEARLFEISSVLWPAYPNAKVTAVRAFDRAGAYFDALLAEIREGKVLSNANYQKLISARDKLNEVIQSAQPEPGDDPLDEERQSAEDDFAFRVREAELKLKGVL